MNTDDFHQIIAHLFYLSQYPMWRSHTWCFKTKVAVRVLSWKNLADLGAWTALMTREMVNEKNMCLHPNAARMEPQNWFFFGTMRTPRCHISSGFLLPVFRKNILNNYHCHRDFRSIKSSWWKTSPLQIDHQGSQWSTQTASQSPAWKRFSWGFAGSPQPQPTLGKLTGAGYSVVN